MSDELWFRTFPSKLMAGAKTLEKWTAYHG